MIASIVGILVVRGGGIINSDAGRSAQRALDRGYWVTAACTVGMFIASVFVLGRWFSGARRGHPHQRGLRLHHPVLHLGVVAPVQEIANALRTGPATNIIAGMAIGFENTALPALTISLALFVSYGLGLQAGPSLQLQNGAHAGIYGTAIATMGMLMSAGYILAMDTFGPITDNAGGIVEMSDQPEDVRRNTDALDLCGEHHQGPDQGLRHRLGVLGAFLLFSAFWTRCAW